MIRILPMDSFSREEIFARFDPPASVQAPVAEILKNVRERGDAALFELTERFDRVRLSSLEVTKEEKTAAMQAVDPAFLAVLREAAEHIRAYHQRQVREPFEFSPREGVTLGQKITPIARVGLYVPGGKAAYPSTVLMDAIPAKIAGCELLVMVTPPQKDGGVLPEILAAAEIAGVDRIFKIGGAQAVAALAYGTESVPKADKIVGPGNAFVAEAKKQVFGEVAIDMIAGPSEILVLADGDNDPAHLAADLLSQAEHDQMASAVLVTDSPALAEKTAREIERLLPLLPREEIARASIEQNGKIIVTKDLTEAIGVANEIAPEHLELCVADPFALLDRVKNAGSVFLGKNCPEAAGDYFAGPNHTLPTGGTARFSSPLSVDDFVKKIQYTHYTAGAIAEEAEKIALFAETEGLSGHARSALCRLKQKK